MPRYGFNFQWLFSRVPNVPASEPNLRQLDLVAEMGLDFVRLPCDYRYWTRGCDYTNMEEEGLLAVDRCIDACRERALHTCLNLHRAPGYCISRIEDERDYLWTDEVAQDGFVSQWETFARRYEGIPNEFLSFDLVNEPRGSDSDRAAHDKVIRRTVAAIRAIDPDREIVIDGWDVGNTPMSEMADLGVIQSGRGYQPAPVSHYQAPWYPEMTRVPHPIYPGTEWDGKIWDKETLREFYQPWREMEQQGVTVHIGEFGCYNKTPNDVALRWFADLLSLYKEFGWGYSLWGFEGAFGIVGHERPGVVYEDWHGYKVDRALLDLYLESRI